MCLSQLLVLCLLSARQMGWMPQRLPLLASVPRLALVPQQGLLPLVPLLQTA